MAFTTKLIISSIGKVESDVKTYLDAQTITTLHVIETFTYGQMVMVFIVFE